MSTKGKTYLAIIIFIIFSMALYVFFLSPIYKEIDNESNDLIGQKINLNLIEKKQKELERLEKKYLEIQSNLEKTQDLFVDKKEPLNFISFLEVNAAESKLWLEISPAVIQKDPAVKKQEKKAEQADELKKGKNEEKQVAKKEEPQDLWPSLIFNISLTGPFPNFMKFFEKLENSDFLVEINSAALGRISEAREANPAMPFKISAGDINSVLIVKVYAKKL